MIWQTGMKVVHRAQRAWGLGTIVEIADDGRRLAVRFTGRDGITLVSGRDPALQFVPPETQIEEPQGGPIELLAAGRADPSSLFALRARALRLEALRRGDSLGALLSSRVNVLPYQIGAAGRILSDRIPRFVLADEVGLGKTIEAGLVFAGLRQLGIAQRVLVVVPEHLSFQWLAELFHKFNALFTLLTPDRIASLGGPQAALEQSPLAIVPLESLRRNRDLGRAAARLPADLLIVDEAHHLVDDALYAAIEPIAREAFGLLLLTATPVRLDPREYYRLLGLVEPVPTTSLEAFLKRLEAHEPFAEVARQLLVDGSPAEAAKRLAELVPDDPFFEQKKPDRESLLRHLADRYSLSSRLIRNRRVKVGSFTDRVLRRQDVPQGKRREAAVELCSDLARAREKVLVMAADVEALRALQEALGHAGFEALLYDTADTIETRDRLVARFRDPDGPMILLSGESGGEGRNFQFAAHLLCYDLPESPLAMEQRIGRLDRLGQSRPVEVHLLPEPGGETFLADLYEHEIGIFREPVGGLDTVLASLPAELKALQKKAVRARESFRRDLAERIAEGRRAQHEGYDPLLDIRSAAIPELVQLIESAFRHLGETPPALGGRAGSAQDPQAVEQALQTLARWLEEELEDLCVDVGRRVGLEVDTDENVHPFEVAFTLGALMRIEALPGMAIPDERVTHLGSFWRETAVARDELEWFATGHKLVEALIGLARDGQAGRAATLRLPWVPARGALCVRFALRWPAPADIAPGARVPARQASRYLAQAHVAVMVDLSPGHRVVAAGGTRLDSELDDPPEVRIAPPPSEVLETARKVAEQEAQEELDRLREEAIERLRAHALSEEERLVEAGFAGGAGREAIDAALIALRAHRNAMERALSEVTLELDASALVVP